MIINSSNLMALFRGFKAIFQKGFEGTKSSFTKIATVVPSNTREESYGWIGKLPRMREWVGDRVIHNLSAYDYKIKNKDFEVTIGVSRNDIEDDTLGIYNPLMESLGQSAAAHPDELVYGLLASGFEDKCYDGKCFFDTQHREGKSGVQSNKGAYRLTPETYGDARAAMMSLKDDQGKPLKIVPILLVAPPQLEGMAKKILTADLINGESNIYKGSAELHVEPELSGNPTAWFLLDTSKPIKPIIFQERKKPQFVALDKAEDENVFMKKEYVYGVDSRGNAGYGLWQLAYGSTGETDKPVN